MASPCRRIILVVIALKRLLPQYLLIPVDLFASLLQIRLRAAFHIDLLFPVLVCLSPDACGVRIIDLPFHQFRFDTLPQDLVEDFLYDLVVPESPTILAGSRCIGSFLCHPNPQNHLYAML